MKIVGCFSLIVFFLIMIIFIIVPISYVSIKLVKKSEKGIIERFGKYLKTCEPGIVFIIPFVDSFIRMDLKEKLINFETIYFKSSDGREVEINGTILYEVFDPLKAHYEIEDLDFALTKYCLSFIRDQINLLTSEDLSTRRKDLNLELEKIAKEDEKLKKWGIKINDIMLEDFFIN